MLRFRTIKLIEYPICWRMLELLKDPDFVNNWKNNWDEMKKFYEGQIFNHYIDLSKLDSNK